MDLVFGSDRRSDTEGSTSFAGVTNFTPLDNQGRLPDRSDNGFLSSIDNVHSSDSLWLELSAGAAK